MTLKSSEIKNFLSWWISTILKSFPCFLHLPAVQLFHISHQCREFSNSFRRHSFHLQNSIAPSSSRSRSPWRRGVLSCFLTLGKRLANDLLAQHQSTFFPRWVKFLWMSWQEYVFVVLLQPLIGSQKQVNSSSTQILRTSSQRFLARCCPSPLPTYSSHEKIWPTIENCLCS